MNEDAENAVPVQREAQRVRVPGPHRRKEGEGGGESGDCCPLNHRQSKS